MTTTYLGLRPAVAIATGLAAVTFGAAIGLTVPTPTPCAIVEAGPTGPEPEVTLGRVVEVCADGTYRTTTYVLDTGELVEVDHHDGHLTDDEARDVADRLATIRAERSGTRWSR
jgi:hypothetical protein